MVRFKRRQSVEHLRDTIGAKRAVDVDGRSPGCRGFNPCVSGADITRHVKTTSGLAHLTGGVPVFLWPIMIPVEILGLFTKPFALLVRLFANMHSAMVE